MSNDPLDEFRTCQHCQQSYNTRKGEILRRYELTHCSKEHALLSGLSKEEVNALVRRCAGCEQYFPHEDLTFRKGDYGYTPLCQTCADDPKYYCFFPYEDRLAAGLATSKERDEHNANWNAFHDM